MIIAGFEELVKTRLDEAHWYLGFEGSKYKG